MYLSQLKVRGVRNLAEVAIAPCPGLNLLYGANASGKTSLLEAAHLLGVARSFRTGKIGEVITHGLDEATVYGRIEEARPRRIGVCRSREGQTTLQIDGERVHSSSELARLMPLQLITPDSHRLVSEGPRERRRFLDWGLFHVEPSFHSLWQRYERSLRQRNAELREGRTVRELVVWEEMLAAAGEALSEARFNYLQRLESVVSSYMERLLGGSTVQLSYQRGWPTDQPLAETLKRSRERDRQQGFTRAGPHRADLLLRVGERAAAEVLSRGQQKLVMCALKLAQIALLKQESGRNPLVLLDDLPAELDRERRHRLLELLSQTGSQLFVTATERDEIDLGPFSPTRMFHVEHGGVTEVV